MHDSTKFKPYLRLMLLLLTLLTLAGCGSDAPAVDEATPELAVVEFATPDPNATDTPAPTATAPPNTPPTAAVSPTTPSIATGSAAAPLDYETIAADRPANINPLTGLEVSDPALLQRRPLMVRVGNDPGARPQVALNQADMVYEEITEWWVTRFTAIFLSRDPAMIAPIRSARLINLQLAPQYQGALGNSGGSDGVRWELSQTDIVNLDEFFVPQPYFYRENEGWQTRLAFDATVARQHLAEAGLEQNVNLRGFYFTEQIDAASLPPGVLDEAQVASIPFPQATSKTSWLYDDASETYLRQTQDAPHLDADGEQLAAANVIIYFADHQETDIVEDSNGATSIRININGRGAAWLLRDGQILRGNWETDGRQTPMFVFDNNQPMPLKPGNIWVQVVPLDAFITIDGQEYSSLPSNAPSAAETAPEDDNAPAPAEEVTAMPSPTLTPIGARPSSP